MKKIFLLSSLAALMCLTFYGCKKDNRNKAPEASQWAINRVTYHGTLSWFNAPILSSLDDLGNQIGIYFGSIPPSSGTYKVVAASPGASECTLFLSRDETSANYYSSTGEAGNIVTLTNAGGKMTAFFSDIIVISLVGGPTKSVTGTLIGP